jgi:hypothetical protein
MGELFYFHRDALKVWIKTNWLTLIVLLIAGHAAMFLGNALTATIGPYLGIGVMFCLLAVWKEETASRTQDFFGRASYHLFIGAYRRHLGDGSRIEGGKHFRLFRHYRSGAGSQRGLGADRAHHQPGAAAHCQLSPTGRKLWPS